MRKECIEAVAKALGRELRAGEAKDIESRVERAMRQEARRNRTDWMQMSQADRLTMAAKRAGEELRAEAVKQAERSALQIAANSRVMNRMTKVAPEVKTHAAAVVRQIEQVDAYRKGVEREYFSNLVQTLRAASPKWFGFVENPVAVRDFAREVFGQHTGNDLAAKGAKAWIETAEEMRQRFNRAGGDIRKLSYGYLPQRHNTRAIQRVEPAQWAHELLPKLDRSRYTNPDGSLLDDAALTSVLREIHESITSDGLNDLEPGKFKGAAMRAKRGIESRELHFKDADAYLDYMTKYGRGTVYEIMRGHVGALARDIALVEQFGPNPEATFRMLEDSATKADGGTKFVGPFLVRPKDVWNVLSGYTGQTSHARLARLGQDARSITTSIKLVGTLLSSFGDLPTLLLTGNYNRIGAGRTLAETVRAFGKESREYANRVGLISDSMIGDMARFADTNLRETFTGKMANFTMKAGLLNAWSDALRRGFSISLMGSLGKLTRESWDAMPGVDRKRLEARGITQAHWDVWRAAKPEDWRGSTMLTPEAIRAIPDSTLGNDAQRVRDAAASKLLGFIIDESEHAVVSPDIYTRAALTRSTQSGTIEGEFLRSLFLFKGYPMAMITRHLKRVQQIARDEGVRGALPYAGSLIGGLWLMGALSLQAKSVASGQDPRNMRDKRFWLASLAQGGGLGIYGDVLFTGMGGQGRSGMSNWTTLAGPVFGTGFDFANLTLGNLGQASRGQKTHAAGEAVQFAKQFAVPMNFWYTRALFDHLIWQDLAEQASPGYLRTMRQRTQRDFGSDYWWRPGEALPERAPDLAAAVGE